jgi:predicted AlkP superfamily pyrophosphatase or phosphodiesterase
VLVCIDGLRADAVTPELMPYLARLTQQGAFTGKATCLRPSLTIPNIVSMLTGRFPTSHGFTRNAEFSDTVVVHHTLFELAHQAGLTTAAYLGKPKLKILVKPGMLDRDMVFPAGSSPQIVASFARDMAQPDTQWQVSFVHLTDPDVAGHANGWMSAEYLAAVSAADRHLRTLVSVLEASELNASTLLIVTADHGGRGMHHDESVPEVLTIPWLAVGPGIMPGHALAGPVVVHDTTPTILRALGLPVPRNMEGKVVEEIFATEEAAAP